MCTNGTQVLCEVSSLTAGVYNPLLFSKSDVGFFKNKSVKVLWEGTYGFSSLSEKTRKYNHLQMSLHRQHFLGPTTVWTCDLLLADFCSPNWANQVAVINVPDELRRQSYSVGPSSSFICICQYLEAKSRQKKHWAPPKASNTSSVQGNWYIWHPSLSTG